MGNQERDEDVVEVRLQDHWNGRNNYKSLI